MTGIHVGRRRGTGYACGAETRQRIIAAAIHLFGARGFEGASTREIGRLAGINAPALRYYFDSKEGLYQACAAYLADQTRALLEPALDAARAALAAQAPDEELIECFLVILEASTDAMLGSGNGPEVSDRRMFLAQEQAGHGPDGGFSPQLQAFRQGLARVVVELIGRVTGRAVDDPQLRLRVMTLYGQLTVFHVAQRSSLQLLGWERIDAAGLALIKSTLRAQSRALIDAWRQEMPAPAAVGN